MQQALSLSLKPEIEAKFQFLEHYPDVHAFRCALLSAGCTLKLPQRHMRIAVFGSDTNPHIQVNCIRVRDEGNLVTLSAKVSPKSNNDPLHAACETCVVVNSYMDTLTILQACGLVQTSYMEKLRETWVYKDVLIEIDTCPFLDPYCEIEALKEIDLHTVAKMLCLPYKTKTIRPVSYLYLKKYPWYKTETAILSKMQHLIFDMENPFTSSEQ